MINAQDVIETLDKEVNNPRAILYRYNIILTYDTAHKALELLKEHQQKTGNWKRTGRKE